MQFFEPAYKVSLIIDGPTLKNHHYAYLTCALKNSIGCSPRDDRIRLHRMIENEYDPSKTADFKKGIDEVVCACTADLQVIDAREILVGNQHIYFGGEIRKAGILIVSEDPVAADLYAAEIMAEH